MVNILANQLSILIVGDTSQLASSLNRLPTVLRIWADPLKFLFIIIIQFCLPVVVYICPML